MSVHYKFKSALDFDTITFDGLHISVADLKKAIIQQKRIGKIADFDLQITNAQTKEEYSDDTTLIPKNTSLTIARIPLAVQPKKQWEPSMEKSSAVRMPVETERAHVDLSRINGSEEDKINAMMMQSTADYDPTKFKSSYQKIRGSSQTGEVPMNYRCFKCHKPGHWIKNCPLIGSSEMTEVKRNTGIPRSFIEQQQNEIIQQPVAPPPVEKKQEIPDDLICSICKDLFTDAVMIPCCGNSFCDECVRTSLLDSEDNECPDCHEKGSSPGSLIPNRFLRNSVNSFKNETGYNRKPVSKPKPKAAPAPPPPPPPEEPKEPAPVVEEKEESDYEDNITVTVPPAHVQCRGAFRDGGQINGRGGRGDESPRGHHLTGVGEEERSETPTVDENDVYAGLGTEEPHQHRSTERHMHMDEMKRRSPHSRDDQHYGQYRELMPTGSYARHGGDYMPRQQPQPLFPTQPRPLYDQPPYGGGNHRLPYHNRMPPGPYAPRGMRPGPPINTLASVYQGVAAKVGPGIIDDPLEAFNRIMREKERMKERRRSRSPELDHRRLVRRRISRGRSPDMRRQRSPERRSEDRRRKRSSSYSRSSRSSRSRTRSPRKISRSPRKRSRTPRNRTRSRSPSFSISRSRSRSISPAGRYRDRGPQHNRYNRSPHSRSPPRHRPREHRRGERRERDDFPRDNYRNKSPPYGGYSRENRGYARSSTRGRGTGYTGHRSERPPLLPQPPQQSQHHEPYYQPPPAAAVPLAYFPDEQYPRYSHRSHPPIQSSTYITNLTPIEPHRFVEAAAEKEPPFRETAKEVDQPPVPGLEGDERFEKYPKESYTYSEAAGGSGAEEGVKSPRDGEGRQLPDSSTNEERRNEERRAEEKESRRNRSRTKSPNKWDIRRATSKEKIRERHEWREGEVASKSRRGGEEKKRVESRVKEREEKKHRESSEDDAKKRAKEKKKRKKEREMEKEKKKAKKEKKREKEAKKESLATREKSRGTRVEPEVVKEVPVEPVEVAPVVEEAPEEEKVVEKAPSEVEEEEEESTTPNHRNVPDDDKLDMSCDLYGDIMDKSDINLDFGQSEGKVEDLPENRDKNSPTFMRNDSILDINPTIDFDQEMEDTETDGRGQEEKKSTPTSVLVTIPEPSKWELEEETAESRAKSIPSDDPTNSSSPDHRSSKVVTNEVLKRAENALFSRAINAIRPIEIRSINAERRKLYEDDVEMVAPVSSVIVKTSPAKELHTFQITVPTNSDGVERSVEIKSGVDVKEKLKIKSSPVRSIKDRLGVKIVDDKEPPATFTPTLESEIRRSTQKGKKESSAKGQPVVPPLSSGQSSPEKKNRHSSPRRTDDRSRRGQWGQRDGKRASSRERRGVARREAERSVRRKSSGERATERRKEERRSDRSRRRSQEKVARDRKRSATPRNRRRSPSKKRSRSPRRSQQREKVRERRKSAEVKAPKVKEVEVRKTPPQPPPQPPPEALKREEAKKLVCDESTFEPDYENPPPGEEKVAAEEPPVEAKDITYSPEPLRGEKTTEKKVVASASTSSSSDSESTEGESVADERKRKKRSKHRKQKRKRTSSAESVEKVSAAKKAKKSKKKSSKSHKKKKKNRHK